MKGKRFYLILIGLIVVGISSIYMYRQQQEARALEFEGYEISSIESRVNKLYNEDQTDIKENISDELMNLEQIFSELSKKELSYRSEHRIQSLKEDVLNAKKMYELQVNILELFEKEENVRKNLSNQELEELETSLNMFKDRVQYFERNREYIGDARAQLEAIEEATEMVNKLTEDGKIQENLELDDLEEAEELIKQLKDKELQKSLMNQLEVIRIALTESEELAIELEEGLEEPVELEEALNEEIQEEEVEEERVEVVQESTQIDEQSSTSTTAKNTQSSSTQQQTTNRTQANQSQNQTSSTKGSTTAQKSSSTNNKKSSTPSKQEKPASSSNQPIQQTPESTGAKENKPDPNRNSVAEKYRETEIVEEYPYSTREKTDKSVAAGTVLEPGRPGRKTVTYEVTIYTNGLSSRQSISENITLPKDELIAVGGTSQEPSIDE